MRRSSANFILLLTALIWGSAFIPQYLSMQHMGPLAFTSIRFALGAVCVLPLAVWEYRRLHAAQHTPSARRWLQWLGLGVLLFGGAALQQIGIPHTSVTNAGFITALYVPIVPVLLYLLGQGRPSNSIWLANAVCVFGVFLLGGGHLHALNIGDTWILAGAVFWALHMIAVGHSISRHPAPLCLATVQFAVCALCSGVASLLVESTTWAQVQAAGLSLLYGGVLSVGVGYTLQVIAQRHTGAADCALILSSEFLFAAIAGYWVLHEVLSPLQITGAVLIFTGILLVQLLPIWQQRRAPKPACSVLR